MPPRVPKGAGDTLQERVDNFIQKYNNWTGFSGGEGVVFGESSHVSRRNLFLDESKGIHELSLGNLREFPKYLCDVTLRSKHSVISAEHYSYWSWTFAFRDYVRKNGSEFERYTDPESESTPVSPGSTNLINDMFLMHRLLYLPLRMTAPATNASVEDYLRHALKLPNSLSEQSTLQLFGPLCLSLLDGLVCRRCRNSLTIDGDLKNPPYRLPGAGITVPSRA